jgi:leucyl-tRNA synthetase
VQASIDWLTEKELGRRSVRYRLRDWLISRQRYWGPPIPMIHCERHGWQPVPEDQLPVRLPLTDDFRPTGSGQSPLAAIPGFVSTTCPVCGGPARRETDVSDNFLDSAWYFLRYVSTECDDRPWEWERVRRWLPVAHYMGGIEHSTLHHLYARFIWKAMFDLGHLPPEVGEEPFRQLRLHGWILRDGAKMSKSRGNVVNPDEYVRQNGADVMRMHMLFSGSYTEGGDFRDAAITGIVRFYKRVWEWVTLGGAEDGPAEEVARARRTLHRAIKKVGEDLPALSFNTALAALMETLNSLRECRLPRATHQELARTYVLLLAPMAPLLAEELWERLGGAFSVHLQRWPAFDPALLTEETLVVPVQINGRLRGRVEVAATASEGEITQAALAAPAIRKHIGGQQVIRTIYLPGRLLNIVAQ